MTHATARLLACLLAGWMLAAVASPSPAASADEESACPDVYLLGLHGTGQRAEGMGPQVDAFSRVLGRIVEADGLTFVADNVDYRDATLGEITWPGGYDYADGVLAGARLTRDMLLAKTAECRNLDIVVAGFSQGGHAAKESVRLLPWSARRHVVAVVLIAEPSHDVEEPLGAHFFRGETRYEPAHGDGLITYFPLLFPDASPIPGWARARTASICWGWSASPDPVCNFEAAPSGMDTPWAAFRVAAHTRPYTRGTVLRPVAEWVADRID